MDKNKCPKLKIQNTFQKIKREKLFNFIDFLSIKLLKLINI